MSLIQLTTSCCDACMSHVGSLCVRKWGNIVCEFGCDRKACTLFGNNHPASGIVPVICLCQGFTSDQLPICVYELDELWHTMRYGMVEHTPTHPVPTRKEYETAIALHNYEIRHCDACGDRWMPTVM